MHLFDNFDNTPYNYIPDNMHQYCPCSIDLKLINDNVDPILDKCGNIKGFSWDYGEDVSIKINNRLILTLPAYCIISYIPGKEPDSKTQGSFTGLKFYNLADLESWTLITILDDLYTWEKDDKLTYPSNGPQVVSVDIDMSNKSNIIELLNFRKEVIKTYTFDHLLDFNWSLTSEESKEIQKGIYYMNIYTIEDLKEILNKCYEIDIR